MISKMVISALLSGMAVTEASVPAMPMRLEWVQEVKSLLPTVQAADRLAAYRNYANMLVDVDQCDAAIDILKNDMSFDAQLIVSVMAHASSLGERQCAGKLGKLAVSRIDVSNLTSPQHRAYIRMTAGAAIRVGGDDVLGAAMIADAEKSLESDTSQTLLWSGRASVLSTYAGTPLFAPTMTQYAQQLAANLSHSKSYMSVPNLSGFVLRFAASGRTDLVDLVAGKLWPSDKREVMSAVGMAHLPEFAEVYGNNPAPHCVKAVDASGSTPIMPDNSEPFRTILALSMRSSVAANYVRCNAFP